MSQPRRFRREEWLDVRPYWVPPEAGGRLILQGPCVLVAAVSVADEATAAFKTTIYDGLDTTGRVVWQSGRASQGRAWWVRLVNGLYVNAGGGTSGMMVVAAPLSEAAINEAARYK